MGIVHVQVFELVADARQHAHQILHRTHTPDRAQLVEEIVHGHRALGHLVLKSLRFLRGDFLLRFFDETDDVAHAEDARRDAFGVKFFERVEVFAHAHEFDRRAGDLFDRQRRAAACVGVKFGQDHAVEFKLIVECLGGVDGVLAGHCVDDQVNLVRTQRCVDLAQFVHQLVIDMQPAGGVEHEHLAIVVVCGLQGVLADGHRGSDGLAVLGDLVHLRVEVNLTWPLEVFDLVGQCFELLDGGRALKVGGTQHRVAASLFQVGGELAARGCLARTLQTAHHHDRRAGVDLHQVCVDRAHQVDQFVVDDLDHQLRGLEARKHLRAHRQL